MAGRPAPAVVDSAGRAPTAPPETRAERARRLAYALSHRFPNLLDLVEDAVRSRPFVVALWITVFVAVLRNSFWLLFLSPASQLVFTENVGAIEVVVMPAEATLGYPLPVAPVVRITNFEGSALPGRVVTVSAAFMRERALREALADTYMQYSDALTTHFALAGALAVETDAYGYAEFADLSVQYGLPGSYQLAFECEGAVTAQGPLDSLVFLRSEVASVEAQLDADGEEYTFTVRDGAGRPLAGRYLTPRLFPVAHPDVIALPTFAVLSTTVAGPSDADGRLQSPDSWIQAASSSVLGFHMQCEGVDSEAIVFPLGVGSMYGAAELRFAVQPSAAVAEGEPLPRQPVALVLDAQGAPVAGATVLALVFEEAGVLAELRGPFSTSGVGKQLTHVVSLPSNASGHAVFERLGFTAGGPAGRYAIELAETDLRSAPSDPIEVASSVARVSLSAVPEGPIVLDQAALGDAGTGRIAPTLTALVQAASGDRLWGKSGRIIVDNSSYVTRHVDPAFDSHLAAEWLPSSSTSGYLTFDDYALVVGPSGSVRFAIEVEGVASEWTAPVAVENRDAPDSASCTHLVVGGVPDPLLLGGPMYGGAQAVVHARALNSHGRAVPGVSVEAAAWPFGEGPFFLVDGAATNYDTYTDATGSDWWLFPNATNATGQAACGDYMAISGWENSWFLPTFRGYGHALCMHEMRPISTVSLIQSLDIAQVPDYRGVAGHAFHTPLVLQLTSSDDPESYSVPFRYQWVKDNELVGLIAHTFPGFLSPLSLHYETTLLWFSGQLIAGGTDADMYLGPVDIVRAADGSYNYSHVSIQPNVAGSLSLFAYELGSHSSATDVFFVEPAVASIELLVPPNNGSAVTVGYGGMAVMPRARVLDRDGQPVADVELRIALDAPAEDTLLVSLADDASDELAADRATLDQFALCAGGCPPSVALTDADGEVEFVGLHLLRAPASGQFRFNVSFGHPAIKCQMLPVHVCEPDPLLVPVVAQSEPVEVVNPVTAVAQVSPYPEVVALGAAPARSMFVQVDASDAAVASLVTVTAVNAESGEQATLGNAQQFADADSLLAEFPDLVFEAGSPGLYQLSVEAAGATAATGQSVMVTTDALWVELASAPAPDVVRPGQVLELSVRVLVAEEMAMPGVDVHLSLAANALGGELDGDTVSVTTGADGLAVFRTSLVGGRSGNYSLQASVTTSVLTLVSAASAPVSLVAAVDAVELVNRAQLEANPRRAYNLATLSNAWYRPAFEAAVEEHEPSGVEPVVRVRDSDGAGVCCQVVSLRLSSPDVVVGLAGGACEMGGWLGADACPDPPVTGADGEVALDGFEFTSGNSDPALELVVVVNGVESEPLRVDYLNPLDNTEIEARLDLELLKMVGGALPFMWGLRSRSRSSLGLRGRIGLTFFFILAAVSLVSNFAVQQAYVEDFYTGTNPGLNLLTFLAVVSVGASFLLGVYALWAGGDSYRTKVAALRRHAAARIPFGLVRFLRLRVKRRADAAAAMQTPLAIRFFSAAEGRRLVVPELSSESQGEEWVQYRPAVHERLLQPPAPGSGGTLHAPQHQLLLARAFPRASATMPAEHLFQHHRGVLMPGLCHDTPAGTMVVLAAAGGADNRTPLAVGTLDATAAPGAVSLSRCHRFSADKGEWTAEPEERAAFAEEALSRARSLELVPEPAAPPTAFRFPLRMWVAFGLSALVTVAAMVLVVLGAHAVESAILDGWADLVAEEYEAYRQVAGAIDGRVADAIGAYQSERVLTGFNLSGVDVDLSGVSEMEQAARLLVVAQLLEDNEEMRDTFTALLTSSAVAAAVLAFLTTLGTWVVMAHSYRRMVLQARRGEIPFRWRRFSAGKSLNYVGLQCGHCVVGAIVAAITWTLLIMLARWPGVRASLMDTMQSTAVMGFAILLLSIKLVVTLLMKYALASKSMIRHRHLFVGFDTVYTGIQVTTGCIYSVLRLMVVGVLLGAVLMRMDAVLVPDELLGWDPAFAAYASMAQVDLQYNNPVLKTWSDGAVRRLHRRRRLRGAGPCAAAAALGIVPGSPPAPAPIPPPTTDDAPSQATSALEAEYLRWRGSLAEAATAAPQTRNRLTVRVLAARELAGLPAETIKQLYCKVRLLPEGVSQRTRVARALVGLNPVWDEVLELPVSESTQTVRLYVMQRGSGVPLAAWAVPLTGLDAACGSKRWVPLGPSSPRAGSSGSGVGSLRIEMQWQADPDFYARRARWERMSFAEALVARTLGARAFRHLSVPEDVAGELRAREASTEGSADELVVRLAGLVLRRRVINRWMLAMTLLANPTLRRFRASVVVVSSAAESSASASSGSGSGLLHDSTVVNELLTRAHAVGDGRLRHRLVSAIEDAFEEMHRPTTTSVSSSSSSLPPPNPPALSSVGEGSGLSPLVVGR